METPVEIVCLTDLVKRIEKLESAQLGQQLDPQVWKFLHERVDKLESDHLDQLNPHAFLILKKEIEELRNHVEELCRFQDITHKQYQFNIGKSSEKFSLTPHKCPVCDG